MFVFIFFVLPIAAIVFFIVSLVRYIMARSEAKQNPDAYWQQETKNRGVVLTIASIIAGIFVAAVVSVVVILFMAVAYM